MALHAQMWWETASTLLRATLWTLLADLPPDMSLLLLATSDVPSSVLDSEAATIFGGLAGSVYELGPPGIRARSAFFESLAQVAAFPLVPPPPPRLRTTPPPVRLCLLQHLQGSCAAGYTSLCGPSVHLPCSAETAMVAFMQMHSATHAPILHKVNDDFEQDFGGVRGYSKS